MYRDRALDYPSIDPIHQDDFCPGIVASNPRQRLRNRQQLDTLVIVEDTVNPAAPAGEFSTMASKIEMTARGNA